MTPNPTVEADDLAKSFLAVRKAIGLLGAGLPLLLLGLALAERFVPPSISDSYYHYGRDLFVGTLVALGVFLVSYVGHKRKGLERFSDRRLSTVAGIAVLGVAFIPTGAPTGTLLPFVHRWLTPGVASSLHYVFAGLFFVCLAVFCLVQFRLGPVDNAMRAYCHRIYATCGYVIVATIVLMGAAAIVRSTTGTSLVGDAKLIFVLESIGVIAFGFAWFVKGRGMEKGIGVLAERSKTAALRAQAQVPVNDFVFRTLAMKKPARKGTKIKAEA